MGNSDLLGYESFLRTQRRALVWWEPPAAIASIAITAIASYRQRPWSTLDYYGLGISALVAAAVVLSAVNMTKTRRRFGAVVASQTQDRTSTQAPAATQGPASEKPRSPYKTVMVALLYPAAVGTGFVLLLQDIAGNGLASVLRRVTTYFAVVLLFYFSVTFLVTEDFVDERYRILRFTLDSVEIILILLAFWFLGLPVPEACNLPCFFWCIAALQVVHVLWRVTMRESDFRSQTGRPRQGILLAINCVLLIFFTVGAILGDSRWFSPVAVAILALSLALYRILAKPQFLPLS